MASTTASGTPIKTYIVEHLDDELGPWSELEYLAIARETEAAGGARFCLSSLPPALRVPDALRRIPAFAAETRGVEDLFAPGDGSRSRVCLLDPAAASDLSPEDGDRFDVFLFGGILGGFFFFFTKKGVGWLLTQLQGITPQEVSKKKKKNHSVSQSLPRR